ncbi:MAG: class I SAM-dependent rRNA methyltransferase [Chloroflexota bacterium]|jgi:23S rRNA (cytosine1962-C5)-methyltransferase
MDRLPTALILKPGRDKPVRNRHPWIFSGAIAALEGPEPKPGGLVDILDDQRQWLARGYYNRHSQIRARVLSWSAPQPIDRAFWSSKIRQALALRRSLALEPETNAYRLVNAESDGLPGLIVDKYADFLVIQCLTAGIDSRKSELISILGDLLKPAGVIERSDASVRKKEGLRKESGLRFGVPPPTPLTVMENGIIMQADLHQGHKSGLYLDQRENRSHVGQSRVVGGRDVLNVFAYTGAFGLYAARAGASTITNIEQSADFLETARLNMSLNGYERNQDSYLSGDAFQLLRQLRESGESYDVVILDPPKFASSRKDVLAASRGYKDLNFQALHLLRPEGILATFSCSGHIDLDLFQKILFAAAVDAGRDVQILRYLTQGPDHPIAVNFPESAYLKGFLCRVL